MDQFFRMQQLAGIKSTNVEDLLNEAIFEYYLYTNYYSKGILKENLSEGFIEKLKDKIKNLKLPSTAGVVASILKGIKNNVGEETFRKLIAIADNFKGNSKDKKEVIDYVEKELEKLNNQEIAEGWVRNKKGEITKLAKTIVTALALLILTKASGADKLIKANIDNVPANIEANADTFKQAGASDSNVKAFDDFQKETNKFDSKTPTDTGDTKGSTSTGNTINVEKDGTIKVGFGTGEFKVADEDGTAKKVADDIIKQAGGKEIKSLTLNIKGLISNTPGVGDDDPNGPGKKGLGDNRLEAGKTLAQKVSDILKDKYKNIQVNIEDGGTNVKDPGPEVSKNSEEAKKNQAVSFSVKDLKTNDGEKAPSPKVDLGPDAAGYLKNPRVIQPDGNKLYTILGHILPLIIKDDTYNKFYSELTTALNDKAEKTKKKFPVTRNNLDILKDESKDKDFKKILQWATDVDRDSKSIGEFLNNLDKKMPKLGQPGEKYLPGKEGTAASTSGTGTTQTPIPGPKPGETTKLGEISLLNIHEYLLTEASVSEFTSLPGFDGNKATSNLGILVPLYCYTWNIMDESFNVALAHVRKNYASSFNKFSEKYPVIVGKIGKKAPSEKPSKPETSTASTGEPKPSTAGTQSQTPGVQSQTPGTQSIARFDSKADKVKVQTDVARVTQAINRDGTFKSYLKRIDNVDELANFILALFLYRDTKGDPIFPPDKTFFTDTGRVRSALFALHNTIPNELKEEDSEQIFAKFPDVKAAYTHIGRSSTLRNLLKNVNTSLEFTQMVIYSILPYINPKFRTKNGVKDLKRAIYKAASMSSKYKDILDKPRKKTLSSTAKDIKLTEEFIRMQKLAGLITESEYQKKKESITEGFLSLDPYEENPKKNFEYRVVYYDINDESMSKPQYQTIFQYQHPSRSVVNMFLDTKGMSGKLIPILLDKEGKNVGFKNEDDATYMKNMKMLGWNEPPALGWQAG